jgi:deazaflavin-dependent oxidoreductase (nitroreductase family)
MWYNPIIKWLLRSPFHGTVSKNMMLISYAGRKSGKLYTTPVNYLRLQDQEGEFLAITSLRERVWWHNLRGGSQVTLRFQGQDLQATAEVCEDDQGVLEGMLAYFRQAPSLARYYDLELDENGEPIPEEVARVAQGRVFIKIRLAK